MASHEWCGWEEFLARFFPSFRWKKGNNENPRISNREHRIRNTRNKLFNHIIYYYSCVWFIVTKMLRYDSMAIVVEYIPIPNICWMFGVVIIMSVPRRVQNKCIYCVIPSPKILASNFHLCLSIRYSPCVRRTSPVTRSTHKAQPFFRNISKMFTMISANIHIYVIVITQDPKLSMHDVCV